MTMLPVWEALREKFPGRVRPLEAPSELQLCIRLDNADAREVVHYLRTQQEARLVKQEATNDELKTLVAQQQNDFKATIAQQQKQIEALTAGLGKIAFEVELSKPTAKVANQ